MVEALAWEKFCCECKLQSFGFTCVEDSKASLASASTIPGPGMELGLEYLSSGQSERG